MFMLVLCLVEGLRSTIPLRTCPCMQSLHCIVGVNVVRAYPVAVRLVLWRANSDARLATLGRSDQEVAHIGPSARSRRHAGPSSPEPSKAKAGPAPRLQPEPSPGPSPGRPRLLRLSGPPRRHNAASATASITMAITRGACTSEPLAACRAIACKRTALLMRAWRPKLGEGKLLTSAPAHSEVAGPDIVCGAAGTGTALVPARRQVLGNMTVK